MGLLSKCYRWGTAVLACVVIAVPAWCQRGAQFPVAPAADGQKMPVFDVISVKPGKGDGSGLQLRFTPDGFVAKDLNLHVLIGESYLVDDNQILGEPVWAKKQGFDIEAKVEGQQVAALHNLSFDERRSMFKQVLTERFKLAVHHEQRELQVYALTVAKGGAKLKPATPYPDAAPITKNGPGKLQVSAGTISGEDTTIPYFVGILSGELGRTVVDKTGLTGSYDLLLTWAGDAGQGGGLGTASAAKDGDAAGPSLFTAIQEQLGLKLELVKTAVDVIVVDHVEKPTEN